MNKMEMRKLMLDGRNAAGDAEFELSELRKIKATGSDEIVTITVTCSSFITLVCCE